MKKIISYLMSIFIAILFIILIIVEVASNTILDYNFILSILSQNDYYGLLDVEIKSKFENYVKQSGLDSEIFENIYSKDKLKEDMENVIKATYNSEEIKINTQSIETNLKNNIDKYLYENNITLNSEQQENMQEYIRKIIDIYEKEVSHPVYLQTVEIIILKASNIIDNYKNIIYTIALILMLTIMILNLKAIYDGLKYIAIGILIASFFIIIGIIIFNLRINIENIIILNTNFTLIVINFLKNIMIKFVKNGIILAIVSIAIITFCNIKNMKKI